MVNIMSSYALDFEQNTAMQIHPIVKHLLAVILGLSVTLGLFVTMYSLIKNEAIPVEASPTKSIPSLRFENPEITNIFENPEAPIKPILEPLPTEVIAPDPIQITRENIIPTGPQFQNVKEKFIPVIENNHILPMVRVNPTYPHVAAAKGIEGFVDIIFDVTETGSTQNIQVVYAEPERVFNSAVIKAVSRWKYKAKMQDGVPVKVVGVRERIRFNLDN
jgi:protein TonB